MTDNIAAENPIDITADYEAYVKFIHTSGKFGWLRVLSIPSDIHISSRLLEQRGVDITKLKTGTKLIVNIIPSERSTPEAGAPASSERYQVNNVISVVTTDGSDPSV